MCAAPAHDYTRDCASPLQALHDRRESNRAPDARGRRRRPQLGLSARQSAAIPVLMRFPAGRKDRLFGRKQEVRGVSRSCLAPQGGRPGPDLNARRSCPAVGGSSELAGAVGAVTTSFAPLFAPLRLATPVSMRFAGRGRNECAPVRPLQSASIPVFMPFPVGRNAFPFGRKQEVRGVFPSSRMTPQGAERPRPCVRRPGHPRRLAELPGWESVPSRCVRPCSRPRWLATPVFKPNPARGAH
jgi:hypothetical protein